MALAAVSTPMSAMYSSLVGMRPSLEQIAASSAEFFAHQVNQRPAFVLTDGIGDKAVFSGLVRLEPLAATLDAMLADTAAYAAHAAHFGGPP